MRVEALNKTIQTAEDVPGHNSLAIHNMHLLVEMQRQARNVEGLTRINRVSMLNRVTKPLQQIR